MYSCYQQPKCSNRGGDEDDHSRQGMNKGRSERESLHKMPHQGQIPGMQSVREEASHASAKPSAKAEQHSRGQPAVPFPLSFLQGLLPHGGTGDLMALLILLLLLSEGREDSHSTILTLLIFLFL